MVCITQSLIKFPGNILDIRKRDMLPSCLFVGKSPSYKTRGSGRVAARTSTKGKTCFT